MAMPSTVITRIDLSSTFTEFNQKMSRQGFIGPKVLRPRMVGIQAADVGKIPIEALLQQHDTNRASGSGYNRGDWNFTKYSYSCSEHGWEEPLDDRNIKIYQDIFDAEAIAAGRAEDIVMRDYEFAVCRPSSTRPPSRPPACPTRAAARARWAGPTPPARRTATPAPRPSGPRSTPPRRSRTWSMPAAW